MISYLVIEWSCMNWWILEVSLGIINVRVTSDGYKRGWISFHLDTTNTTSLLPKIEINTMGFYRHFLSSHS